MGTSIKEFGSRAGDSITKIGRRATEKSEDNDVKMEKSLT